MCKADALQTLLDHLPGQDLLDDDHNHSPKNIMESMLIYRGVTELLFSAPKSKLSQYILA